MTHHDRDLIVKHLTDYAQLVAIQGRIYEVLNLGLSSELIELSEKVMVLADNLLENCIPED